MNPQFKHPKGSIADDGVSSARRKQVSSSPGGFFNRLTLIAILLAGCVWIYSLGTNSENLQIPVVSAPEGPMRVAPEDPGGRLAGNQGLSVNQVIEQGAAVASGDLTFAPEPLGLAAEDLPMGRLRDVESSPSNEERRDTTAKTTRQPNHQTADIIDLNDQADSVASLVEESLSLESVGGGIAIGENEPKDHTVQSTETAESLVSQTVSGVLLSVRPSLRPQELSFPQLNSSPERVALPPETLEVSPEDIPIGTNVVQLGAFSSADVARNEWSRLHSSFGAYMGGKKRIVQFAEGGGRSFYRLRALGFSDLSDARRFCSVLVAEGAECIPVVTR
ncbi:MAG: SPOR domain-containing protein [Aestuariivita sp.]|nr:SPOR domain-containing protein [Aestuariivita sp.]MCY4203205.1 SPOR domain-containing protein [Aestuariivita sp.]MCY4289065.1 SPOR domain-containing protein [Aestuariivita sp.]MCY4345755.1 SPOR domain-containing protein [Aestuariivita sp.]